MNIFPITLSIAKNKGMNIATFTIFFNYGSNCNLSDTPSSIYDKKRWPEVLTLSVAFDALSVSRNLFPKTKLAIKLQLLNSLKE